MLLESILNGAISPQTIIIQETSDVRAESILLKLLRNRITNPRIDLANIICFEHKPTYFMDSLMQSKKILIHDGHSDPLRWNVDKDSLTGDQTDVCAVNLETNLINRIKKSSKEHLKKSEMRIAVYVDGLSFLLRHKGIHDVCTLLKSLTNLKNKVVVTEIVATVQKDLISSRCINAVRYIADAVIDLVPNQQKTLRSNRGSQAQQTSLEIDTTLKKASGKIQRENFLYNVSRELDFIKMNRDRVDENNDNYIHQADPTANLPFNLKLTESEKQARSQIKLPYTLNYDEKIQQLRCPDGGGQIVYHPDEGDDFDEEDPDEDLDI